MLGIGLMILSAGLNASASVLQRSATRNEPESRSFSVGLLRDLARRPLWLLGITSMIVGFVLHGISISVSQIALVQPLLVLELPFTILLASRAFHTRVERNDWTALALQTAGLATFVGCLAPQGGAPEAVPVKVWVIGIIATVGVVVVLVILGHRAHHEHRATFLGVATGAAFGLNSSFIAGVGASVAHGGGLLTTWQTYGVVVVGPTSFFLLQNALSAGNLVASQPGMTLTNPLVSVLWGLVVFGEQARGGLFVIGGVAGGVMIAAGSILLARSPLLDPDTAGTKTGAAPDRE